VRNVFDESIRGGIAGAGNDNRDRLRIPLHGQGCRAGTDHDRIRSKVHNLVGVCVDAVGIATGETEIDPQIASFCPAEFREGLAECRDRGLDQPISLDAAA
jgi:hypothetical protein